MGQGQSSSNNATVDEPPVKRDYYELLGVDRTATDDELKRAYRKRALELHPDRNYGKEEAATKHFAEIQAAYEVLSDAQERAWYDSHRDVLLRGQDAGGKEGGEYSYNMKLTTADEVLKLMMRFNKKVEFTDAPSGFFGGLHDFFKQLAKEEDIACQWQDLDYQDYPEFGTKEDDYEDIVRPFYSVWSSFSTKKSYSWKDQYRLSDAPDRRIRRLMEKENQKLRDEAIAEYNDAIRSLVAFVRKRDPRVQNNQKSDAERQRILRDSAAAQAARAKAKRQQELEKNASSGISAWAQSRPKDKYEGGFSSESEVEEHQYECVVCDKTFKSEAQFYAHEKSKKHTKLLKELKRKMKKEGEDLDPGLEPKSEWTQPVEGLAEDVSDVEENGTQKSAPDSDANREEQSQSKRGGKDSFSKTNAFGPVLASEESSKSDGDDGDDDDDDDENDNGNDEDDYAPRATIASRLRDDNIDEVTAETTSVTLDDTPTVSGADTPSKQKIGKAKQRRAKKAAQKESIEATSASEMTCAVCKAEFPSKTKLFDHIKREGHAALKSDMKASGVKGGRTKKKR